MNSYLEQIVFTEILFVFNVNIFYYWQSIKFRFETLKCKMICKQFYLNWIEYVTPKII